MGAPDFSNVPAQEGKKVTEAGCLGDGGKDGEGLLGVRDTADGGSFVQVLGANVFVLQR